MENLDPSKAYIINLNLKQRNTTLTTGPDGALSLVMFFLNVFWKDKKCKVVFIFQYMVNIYITWKGNQSSNILLLAVWSIILTFVILTGY